MRSEAWLAAVIAADQGTKAAGLIARGAEPSPVPAWVEYGFMAVLVLVPLGAYYWRTRRTRGATQIGFALLLGAVLSNLVDSAWTGRLGYPHHLLPYSVAEGCMDLGILLIVAARVSGLWKEVEEFP